MAEDDGAADGGSAFLEAADAAYQQGDFPAALRLARMGAALEPERRALWARLGEAAERLDAIEVAEDAWRRVLALDPEDADALNHLGILLDRRGAWVEAESAYRRALLRCPDDAALLGNLGLLYENTGRLAEAEALQRRALARDPASPALLNNLGGLCRKRGAPEEAEACYRAALRHAPGFAAAHGNLAILLTEQERFAEAEAEFRTALQLADTPQAHSNYAQLLLMQGRLAEAWPHFEARGTLTDVRARDLRHLTDTRGASIRRWQGEPLAGKSIVVLPEQGLGDEIQFARYLSWLRAEGPARLIYVCYPPLLRLMQTVDGPDEVLAAGDFAGLPETIDYWTFLMSLPGRAGTTLTRLPAEVPYFAVRPEWRKKPFQRPPGAKLCVGLVWRGNPAHSNDAERSLPGLETLAPLWTVPGVHFVSLQKGPPTPGEPAAGPAAYARPAHLPLAEGVAETDDFADTAGLLAGLDLVIGVDTAVAHLAGALGVPTWLLLPAHQTDWRWMRARRDSPWYPHTRLFRQARRGDWATPVAELVEALHAAAAARAV